MLRLVKHPLYLAIFLAAQGFAGTPSVQDLLPREVFEPSEKDLAEARAFLQEITPHAQTQNTEISPTPPTHEESSVSGNPAQNRAAGSSSVETSISNPLRTGYICRENDGPCHELSRPTQERAPDLRVSDLRISILVSFSLSAASLKALYEEARTYGARLVVRGLFKDTFAQTRARVQELGIVVEVDPEIFERLNVKTVPVFVVQKGDHIETIRGHTSVRYALETLSPAFPGLKEKLRLCERRS